MRKFLAIITLLGVLFVPFELTFAQKRLQKTKLIEVGEFHGEEISARTGERWLGLYVGAKESSLKFYEIKVQRVFDPVVDDETKGKTGKKVSVNLLQKPLFLLHQTSLQPSKIETVFIGDKDLQNGTDLTLKLSGANYRIRVESKFPYKEYSLNGDSTLIISSNGKEQILYSLKSKYDVEASWKLLWAGDLDMDNKLDIYIQVSDHYNISERRLFLSSQAKRNKIVSEIAEFRTSGC